MAKGRMINKRIAKSDKIAALKRDRDRVIYFMLYPHLDREGRYSADPRDIKEDCCPRLKYSLREISESLSSLHDAGLITIYTVNDRKYLETSRFGDFQMGLRKDREAPSEIPPNPGLTPENSGERRTCAAKVPLNLNVKSNLKEKVKDVLESEFNQFWKAYPVKEGRDAALVEYRTVRSTVAMEDIAAGFNGYMDFLKHERIHKNFNRAPLNAVNFLRNNRWQEFKDFKYQPPL